jgi:hypothetical protein
MNANILHRQASILEAWTRKLEIHLREIANNESYQRHKGIKKARLREIVALRQLLDEIERELQSEVGNE